MKIAIGSDHAGFELKETLRVFIESLGHETTDVGTHSTESVDYPDFAEKVAVEIISGRADRGVMLCGSGVGASVASVATGGCKSPVEDHGMVANGSCRCSGVGPVSRCSRHAAYAEICCVPVNLPRARFAANSAPTEHP